MFGLIGERLNYSLSKQIHEAIRPMEYQLIPLNKDEFKAFMEEKNFQGINVTIPYKEDVIPYLDEINEEAKAIGAVNTVINKNGKLYGYNTDFYGFKHLVDSLNLDLKNKNVLILGTGGSSKTVQYVLNLYGVTLIHKASRTPKENCISYDKAKENNYYDLIVNTTPVGTYPDLDHSPINLLDFSNCKGLIDLIYNPNPTKLLSQAQDMNIASIGGIDMLYVQAVYANELFSTVMDNKIQEYQTIYKSKVFGTPKIPCSKSLAHRSIICAALGNSISTISNLHSSIDISCTINAMISLGAKINQENKKLTIKPIDYNNLPKQVIIDCHESGTSLRLLIPIVSALGIKGIYKGRTKLFERPLDCYEEIFSNLGIEFTLTKDELIVGKGLKSDIFSLKNLKSSQFASGLLLALPLMNGGTVEILDNMQSSSYFSLTIAVMKEYGIEVKSSTNKITISKNYTSKDYNVEIDYSQLAFFAVLAAINSPLSFEGVFFNSLQGDKVILDILENMGANIDYVDNTLSISPEELQGIKIDVSDCPDLVPILMVLGCFAKGKTSIENTSRLKYKESPRDIKMAEELQKLGIIAEVKENSIIINGPQKMKNGGVLNSHNDHRITMALSILGLSGTYPIEIQDAYSVNKSFPEFFEVVNSIKKDAPNTNNYM